MTVDKLLGVFQTWIFLRVDRLTVKMAPWFICFIAIWSVVRAPYYPELPLASRRSNVIIFL